MSLHNQEYWNRRYNALLKIWEEFRQSPLIDGLMALDHDKFSKAILEAYPRELSKIKEKLSLNILDRHKVAALTTLVVYRSRSIIIRPAGKNNSFCIVAMELFSIMIGLSNLGDPSELIKSCDSTLASLISQLRNNDLSITSLSLIYYKIEEEYKLRVLEGEIKL